MAICPTCGQQVRPTKNAQALLELLSSGPHDREVYIGRDGKWYVTHGGGEWPLSAVMELRKEKHIRAVYSSLPNESFHVGKTLDTDATLKQRKLHGKHGAKVYLTEST